MFMSRNNELKLEITFIDREVILLDVDEASDQIGFFHWGGRDVIEESKRRGYVAVRDGMALALNGPAGIGVDVYPLECIRKMKLIENR